MSEIDTAKASEWKDKGNALLSSKDFDGAIAAYTEVCTTNCHTLTVAYPCSRPVVYL